MGRGREGGGGWLAQFGPQLDEMTVGRGVEGRRGAQKYINA